MVDSPLPPSPNWSRLPHDPAGFFGLNSGFNRLDLKRLYGLWIRRFKPELYPAEFQQIRAAYEQLDLQLRYNTPSNDGSFDTEQRWGLPASPLRPTNPSAISPPHGTVALQERFARESPESIYQSIVDQPQKTAADYIVLALLSDAFESEGDVRFVDWLLQGLAASPQDPALHQVLRHFLSGPVDEDSLPQVLILASQYIIEQAFFPVTEQLWQLLLRAKGFETFRQTLATCERNQPGLQIYNRVAFRIQILRSAIWQADAEWVDQSLTFIEEHFQFIPPQLENEVDLLLALRAYVSQRDDFVARHPLRAELDAGLRRYFTHDELAADQAILDTQLELLNSSERLMEAFPDGDEPALQPFYWLWTWVSRDVQLRNIDDGETTEHDEIWFEQTWNLLSKLERRTDWSLRGVGWTVGSFGFLILMTVVYFATPILATLVFTLTVLSLNLRRQAEDATVGIGAILSILGGLYGGHLLTKKYLYRWKERWSARAARHCYLRQWQPEVFAFIKQSHLNIPLFMAYLAACPTRSASRDWLHLYVSRDYSLALFSLAQRFTV